LCRRIHSNNFFSATLFFPTAATKGFEVASCESSPVVARIYRFPLFTTDTHTHTERE
jgi:hypothetical protein